MNKERLSASVFYDKKMILMGSSLTFLIPVAMTRRLTNKTDKIIYNLSLVGLMVTSLMVHSRRHPKQWLLRLDKMMIYLLIFWNACILQRYGLGKKKALCLAGIVAVLGGSGVYKKYTSLHLIMHLAGSMGTACLIQSL